MQTVLATADPKLIGTYDDWTLVYVQVVGNHPVRLSRRQEEFAMDSTMAGAPGLILLPTTPIQPMWWRGALFVAAVDSDHVPAYVETQVIR